MIRRGMLIGAIPFLAGILTGYMSDIRIIAVSVISLVLWVLFVIKDPIGYIDAAIRSRIMICVFCTVIFGIGVWRAYDERILCDDSVTFFSTGREVSLYGKVYKKEYRNEAWRYYLKQVRFAGVDKAYRGRVIMVSDEADGSIPLGSLIHVEGVADPFRVAENDGGFDERGYYCSMGIYGRVKADHHKTLKDPSNHIAESLFGLRVAMQSVYEEDLPGEEPGILSAMTLGEKGGLTEDIRELFRSAGIAHILAISGLHISIVGQVIYRLLRKKCSGLLSGILSMTVVVLYGLMTGGSISAWRAIVMYGILMISQISGAAYDPLSALALCAVTFLFIAPSYICNPGFIFSFGAVMGVCTVSMPVCDAYKVYARKRWESTNRLDQGTGYKSSPVERIMSGLISAITIWVFTLPVVAYFYYEVPVYVVGLNLIFIPVLKYVVAGGLLGGLFGSISAGGIMGLVSDWVRRGCMIMCHSILYVYEYLSDHSLKLPYASITTGRCPVYRMVIYYALLYLIVSIIIRKAQIYEHIPKERNRGEKCRRFFSGRIYRLSAAIITCAAGFLILIRIPQTSHMSLDMLSVGQGDGIVIVSDERVVSMIDGGSSSNPKLADYVLLPYLKYHGYDHLDYWLISHPDEDHYNGMLSLMREGYRVDNVVLAAGAVRNEGYEEIVSTAKAAGANIILMRQNDVIRTDSMSLTCLGPYEGAVYSDTNEASMVLWLRYKDLDALFTGDMGEGAERDTLRYSDISNLAAERDLELLKVAHHGSKNSSCSEWLEALLPDAAIISAGRNNSYGHPAKETLERLYHIKSSVFCTRDLGQISVDMSDDKIRVIDRERENL